MRPHSSIHPPFTRARRRSLLAGICAAGTVIAVGPRAASAAPEPPPHPHAICDSSGCLITSYWYLDSDGDGVTDSDELAAGTDPYDPASHPPLVKLVDLAGAGELPTYAAGLGQFMIIPSYETALGVDYHMTLDFDTLDPSAGVFAPPKRGDALTRLGLDPSMLGEVKANSATVLLVGITEPTEQGSRPPGMKVSYMDLVKDEDGDTHTHEQKTLSDGTTYINEVDRHADGTMTSVETVKNADGTTVRQTTCTATECHDTTDSYSNPDADSDVVITPDLMGQVLTRLGSRSTPMTVDGGQPLDGAAVAEAVEKHCGLNASGGGVSTISASDTTSDGGANGSGWPCGGVILVDDLAGVTTYAAATPVTSNGAQPETVPGFEPPILDPGANGSTGGNGPKGDTGRPDFN